MDEFNIHNDIPECEPPPPPQMPFSRREINRIRHPRERLVYFIAVIVNIAAIITVFNWLSSEWDAVTSYIDNSRYEFYYDEESEIYYYLNEDDGSYYFWDENDSSYVTVDEIEDVEHIESLEPQSYQASYSDYWDTYYYEPRNQYKLEIFMTVFVLFLLTVFALEFYYASIKAGSVKITSNQFPEIHALAVEYARVLSLKKLPEVYLVQENGVLNAFASKIVRKRFVVLTADLFEVAYREYKDLDTIGFVLAHEMAHHKLKHVSILNRYTVMLAAMLPLVGPLLSRTREYSCDRLAQAVSKNNGVNAIMALTVGKHLYKNVNVNDYLFNTLYTNGFWVWLVNLSSSHPINSKRIRALANPIFPGKLF